MTRSHNSGQLTTASIGETVTLNGWVQTRRDLGGVLFIDLRDRTELCRLYSTLTIREKPCRLPIRYAVNTCLP
jgi:aspartyl-tRNA synthetase